MGGISNPLICTWKQFCLSLFSTLLHPGKPWKKNIFFLRVHLPLQFFAYLNWKLFFGTVINFILTQLFLQNAGLVNKDTVFKQMPFIVKETRKIEQKWCCVCWEWFLKFTMRCQQLFNFQKPFLTLGSQQCIQKLAQTLLMVLGYFPKIKIFILEVHKYFHMINTDEFFCLL